MAPKGAPPAVIARLSEPLSGALLSGGLGARAFNTAMGFGPAAGIPEPMWQQIEADMRLLTIVVRERRLTFDS
jgi:hypothetical protein